MAVSVTESGAMLAANLPSSVTFGIGETSATLTAATDDDAVVEGASAVTAAIASGEGYATASGAGSAQVSVEDNDAATFTVTAAPEAIDEGESATLMVAIANGVTFAEDQTIALDFAGGTAAKGTDYTVSSESVVLTTGSASVQTMLTAVDDTDPEGAETVTVTARHGGAAIGSASVTIEASDAALPAISIAAGTSPVTEGTAAAFTLTRTGPTGEALTVAVSVTESGAMLAANPPAAVTFDVSEGSVTLTAATDDDAVVEAASAVTAAIASGEGYAAASGAGSAQVSVEDNDAATFTVTAAPEAIAEGESATLTVAISNGVTFAEDQTVALALSGTASAADYAGLPAALTLQAGISSTTGEVTASEDQEDEEPEAVTVAASHGGVAIGSATVTIRSVSHDAALAALSLSGVDIGTFSSDKTAYAASVGFATSSAAVTASAVHPRASVSIQPGAEASLAEGDNEITVTVTAEDGTTTKAYTVTVTRAAPPVVLIAAVADRVSEAELARFTVSRTGPTTEPLDVQVLAESTISERRRTVTVQLLRGQGSVTRRVQVGDNTIVEDDVTLTWTLQGGEGYTVSTENASATVVLEENDVPEFALSVEPAEIAEGESATVRVAIANGVSFRQAQTISLSVSGTASASDYTGVPATLTLPAYGSQATTATLAAAADREEETDETVTITASHGGAAIGTATVTITNTALVPLTAQFAGVPESHDGTAAFAFELRFSEEPAVSYRTLRDEAFKVAGGTVRRARRLEPPSSLRWEITVEPASEADVALALPATTDCDAAAAICTAGGKPLSNRPEARVKGPGSQPAGGFSLAPENSTPAGIWSDGETVWVADIEDARLFAYSPGDGERIPEQDISAGPAPMGLWSDGETLWVAGLGGGLRAHRLADGARLPTRDLAAAANAAPAGVWSDGETAWVSDWLGDTVHAYRLADGQREAGRDIRLASGNLMPVGLWSDGEILWVADWRELLYAYRLSDGGREPSRDVLAGAADSDPTGLWSGGGTLLATSWEGSKVLAYRLPALPLSEGAPGKGRGGFLPARAASLPAIADPALKTAIGAALGKASGEAVSLEELAGLEALEAREAGIRDLAGLEAAASLKELDLGFNPLADLRPLAALPRLEALNLDGAVADLQELAPLASVKRLSLRHNGIEDLGPLAGLAALAELDVGDNRIGDLSPLAGLAGLAVLRADRNLIADLWPLAPLSGLEVLDLGANQVRDLQPLAGLARLRVLRLAGNGLAELHPLSGLEGLRGLGLGGNAVENLRALSDLRGLRRLDLRGNPVRDLRPLRALPSLVWVHVGGSRIEDLAPLDGLPGLTVAGPDDRDSPGARSDRAGRAGEQ